MGHYTQMVWHSTRLIGCGVAECGDDTSLWVCQYYPGGNYQGQLPFCKSNKPADMGQCDNIDTKSDPSSMTCSAGTGSCDSDGALCSGEGTSGATTCGSGGDDPTHGCLCANGLESSGSSGEEPSTTAGNAGCDTTSCKVAANFSCSGGSPSAADTCLKGCGDSVKTSTEECDDGTSEGNDGCKSCNI